MGYQALRSSGLTRRAVLFGAASTLAWPLVGSAHPTKPDVVAPNSLAGLVAQVSQGRLRQTIRDLTGFPTRWTESPEFEAVQDWMTAAFQANGTPSAPVTRQVYQTPTGLPRANIVAGNPLDPRGVIVVGAHLDSISEIPASRAPGANDNASGIAAMLEAHRILSGIGLPRGLVWVAFSGEEQGLWGSTECSRIAVQDGWDIRLMLNLDMLGWAGRGGTAPLIVEYDQGNTVSANDAPAREMGLMAAQMAAVHTSLATTHTNIWASDYMPFEAAGFPAIGFYDGGSGAPHIHTSADTIERLDFDRLEQVTRLVVATVATAAGLRD